MSKRDSSRDPVVQLCDGATLGTRFAVITSHDERLRAGLFPLLLKYAGTERDAVGVIHIVISALRIYSEQLATEEELSTLTMQAPLLVGALTDDVKIARAARAGVRTELFLCPLHSAESRSAA